MLSLSFGSSTTVCVCEPRHVCTLVMSFGFLMSEMSNTRTPRKRSLLTESAGLNWPLGLQSMRPLYASADMNMRFLYTDTSFCDAGHSYAAATVGCEGSLMSQITGPL